MYGLEHCLGQADGHHPRSDGRRMLQAIIIAVRAIFNRVLWAAAQVELKSVDFLAAVDDVVVKLDEDVGVLLFAQLSNGHRQ